MTWHHKRSLLNVEHIYATSGYKAPEPSVKMLRLVWLYCMKWTDKKLLQKGVLLRTLLIGSRYTILICKYTQIIGFFEANFHIRQDIFCIWNNAHYIADIERRAIDIEYWFKNHIENGKSTIIVLLFIYMPLCG